MLPTQIVVAPRSGGARRREDNSFPRVLLGMYSQAGTRCVTCTFLVARAYLVGPRRLPVVLVGGVAHLAEPFDLNGHKTHGGLFRPLP